MTSPQPWRVGRKVGRTLYDADDRLIGVMDTVEDARHVVSLQARLAIATEALREMTKPPLVLPGDDATQVADWFAARALAANDKQGTT